MSALYMIVGTLVAPGRAGDVPRIRPLLGRATLRGEGPALLRRLRHAAGALARPARHRVRGGGHSAGRLRQDARRARGGSTGPSARTVLQSQDGPSADRHRRGAGPIANFLLAILFFWVVALLGSQQVRPVIGSVAPESLVAQVGLEAGQELLAVDGEPVTGWSGVNLQLVRRLGESGTLEVRVQEKGSNVDSTHQVRLDGWLKGEDNPDPIASLGIRPWRPALPPVLAELDPQAGAGRRAEARRPLAEHRWHRRRRLAAGGGKRPCPSRAARPAQGTARRRSAGCCPELAVRGEGKARSGYMGRGRRYRMAGGNAPRSELRTAGGGGSGAFPNLDHEPANARLHKENVARRALGKKLERADNHC